MMMPWYRKLGWQTAWGPSTSLRQAGCELEDGGAGARDEAGARQEGCMSVADGSSTEEGENESGFQYGRECLSAGASSSLRKVVFTMPVQSAAGRCGGDAGDSRGRGVAVVRGSMWLVLRWVVLMWVALTSVALALVPVLQVGMMLRLKMTGHKMSGQTV